jgi:methyl-accepting chemotaxis protein
MIDDSGMNLGQRRDKNTKNEKEVKHNPIGIVVKIVVAAGIFFLLLQCYSFYTENSLLRHYYPEQLAEAQAFYWEGWQDGHFRTLRTLANIMANYKDLQTEERRYYFDNLLRSVILSETDMVSIDTIWKPDALDGMDSLYGQYASTLTRRNGPVQMMVNSDIEATMKYLNGPNSTKDRVDDPIPATVNMKETHLIKLMVPILDPDTDEVIGGVGCYLNMDIIQKGVDLLMSYNYDFFMTVYSNNGLIMGSFYTDLVGKMMDADEMLSSHKREAEGAVFDGMYTYFTTYSTLLYDDIVIYMVPIIIGNSDTPWTILTAVPENVLKRHNLWYNLFRRR